MQNSTDRYWYQHPPQQAIIVPTRTIFHPRLDVVVIIGVQDTPKSVCNRIQAKNPYKAILDEIDHQYKISFNGM